MRMRLLLVAASLAANAATAQLPQADHAAKRQAALGALTRDGIIFVEGSAAPPREDQSFIQSQNFQALTGILQPNSALVMWKKGTETGQRIIVPAKPAYAWEGEQIGPVEAAAITGIPSLASGSLRALLDSLDAAHTKVYLIAQDAGWPGLSNQLRMAVGDSGIVSGGRGGRGGGGGAGGGRGAGGAAPGATPPPPPDNDLAAVTRAISQARAKKSDAEIALIRHAAEISVKGHLAAMRYAHPGVTEYELRGQVEGAFITAGGERLGYPSIVGAGANSTFLHYSADTARSKAGDVVVIDAATDFKGYSADVTRTFPVNGKFSPEQKIIYNAVLAAQNAASALVKPGAKMGELTAAANAELWKGLVKAGLVDSVGATYVPTAGGGRGGAGQSQLSLFYFHGLSHGLGLNVHDPNYTENGALVVNSIFTIEPGLYVRPATLDMVADVPANAAFRERLKKAMPKYSGIGTRIEDDFVVTATGSTCLSCAAPRTIAQVEAVTGKGAPAKKKP
ncbi:MAG: aminopeptidase P N-terminal domain-containing protein [Gemmatimonadota bacterium]